MKEFLLGKHQVSQTSRPFIVAEMSGNHNQSLDRALEIVDAAASAGVHALKIQTYTADTMTIPLDTNEFFISDPKSLWEGKSLYSLYQEACTPYEWHKPIFDRCEKNGILGFSTPFDASAVDFLESLNAPFYKIASFEMTDLPLVRRVAQTGKPMVISTGMATGEEIQETVDTARNNGCSKLIILKCTSSYPASPEDSNIRAIPSMKEKFSCHVGLSDHTLGISVALGAIALGACFVEKHFTLNRTEGGVDSAFSLEPQEMKSLVIESEKVWRSLGKDVLGPTENEKKSLQFRRSIYAVSPIKSGETITTENIRCIRPGFGLPPKYFDQLIGKKAKVDMKMGTPIKWELLC